MMKTLTPRDLDVIRELAAGRRYKESACALGIAESTLKAYIYRLCKHLNVDRRLGLMAWYRENCPQFPQFKAMAERMTFSPDEIKQIMAIMTVQLKPPDAN